MTLTARLEIVVTALEETYDAPTFAAHVIDAMEEIERLRRALEGVRRGHCWCEMAVGNPMVNTHSAACLFASRVLGRPR